MVKKNSQMIVDIVDTEFPNKGIGFFDENLIKPKNNITLYEVIKIVNIIIDDSGIYN